jgi:hypothetical protein
MSLAPVAAYLMEFEPHSEAEDARGGAGGPLRLEQRTAAETAARIEAAYASGREEGVRGAAEAFEVKLAEQQRFFDEEATLLRQRWVDEEAALLAGRLVAELKELEGRIADAVARILRPFLDQAVRDSALADLTGLLDRYASKSEGVSFHVSGPKDLAELVGERLRALGVATMVSAAPGCDVRVVADRTIIETQIGAWAARLEEAAR